MSRLGLQLNFSNTLLLIPLNCLFNNLTKNLILFRSLVSCDIIIDLILIKANWMFCFSFCLKTRNWPLFYAVSFFVINFKSYLFPTLVFWKFQKLNTLFNWLDVLVLTNFLSMFIPFYVLFDWIWEVSFILVNECINLPINRLFNEINIDLTGLCSIFFPTPLVLTFSMWIDVCDSFSLATSLDLLNLRD